MDITWVIELIMIIVAFFAQKYGLPILKDILMSKWAYAIVSAASEMNLVGELENKWDFAMKSMKAKLKKYKITFDEEEITAYLKAAVTTLRVNIEGTDAQKIKEQ